MKQIRVCFLSNLFVNTEINKRIELFKKHFLIDTLFDDEFEFVWDDNNPDFLFVSESIYYYDTQPFLKKKFKNIVQNNNPVTIFFAGECIEPDFNIYDYAIVFDRNLSYNHRTVRIPTTLFFRDSIICRENNIKSFDDAKKELNNKKYFCDFIYSNSRAHENRDKLFYEIGKYKKVNSLGKHLKNFEIEDEEIGKLKDWRMQSIKIKGLHKFSIASENAKFEGYTSEKLITSMQAHTVPIYWGDPTVTEEFNERAFINANNYNDFDELINEIKRVDENDELWCKMIMEPWQTQEQINRAIAQAEEYYSFLRKIFETKEYKKGEGFHPNNYRESFFQWKIHILLKNKLKLLIKKIIKKQTYC